MKKGFLSIVLHAHLPYVRHPEYESFFEENWLFEAMTESYIPLIIMFERLQNDQIDFRLTLSLSPTLISMLGDELLQTRYQSYLDKLLELSEKEIIKTRNQPQFQKLARLYRRFFLNTRKTYRNYNGTLLSAFKKFHQSGHLQLITTAATHGFLPLLNVSDTAVRNQVNVGIEVFKSNFGFLPTGFWLPECGYFPGLELTLANTGINYFFTDTHGIMDASEKPANGVYAPLDCGNGVMAFARDPVTTHQVWDAQQGYPGNSHYREYYCDSGLGFDQDNRESFSVDSNDPVKSGIKYYRITGNGLDKEVYQPKNARLEIERDAKDFVKKCQQQINNLSQSMDRLPMIVAAYDAELFGHWWFEGPCWLETVLRLMSEKSNNVELLSCDEYLLQQSSHQVATPSASTWGEEGYSSYWINEENSWIYPVLHRAAEEMEQLVVDFQGVSVSSIQERALNQAVRSLLLAQASDWPFIMKAGTTTEYANKRITDYLARFNYLQECLRKNKIDQRYLLALETMDNIFPDVDFRQYKE
jgi:1,4-alpha-glucan branching enzyme